MDGIELHRVEHYGPALGLRRSGFQFHQHVLQGLIGKILVGMLPGIEPCDIASLAAHLGAIHALVDIGEIDGNGRGMRVLGCLLVGTLIYAEHANPGVLDFDGALRTGDPCDCHEYQTHTWNHTVIIKGEEAL
jgi:hypothetical protein